MTSSGNPNLLMTLGVTPILEASVQATANTIPSPNPIPNAANLTYSYVVDPSVGTTSTGNANTNIVNTQINTAIVNPTKTVSQSIGLIGETVLYTIVMKNTGNTTANSLTLTDTIPSGTTFFTDSVRINGVQQVGLNPQTGINVGTIAVGSVVTVTFIVTLTSVPSPNPTPNTAVTSYSYLVDPSFGTTNNLSNSSNTVATFINATIVPTKTVDRTSASLGDTLLYTIVWKNTLNVPQTNVTFIDTTPNGTTFIANSVTLNGNGQTGSTISPPTGFNIPTVPSGQTVTITFQVRVNTIPTPNPIPNTVTTRYTYMTDPTAGTSRSVTAASNTPTTQINYAELGVIRKSVNKTIADVGSTLGYTITLFNGGNTSAINVNLIDTIPNGTTFMPNSLTLNGVTQTGATIAPPSGFNVGTIPAGTTATIFFIVQVTTFPSPNAIPNAANVKYNYIVDQSSLTTNSASGNTNIVYTTILNATITNTKSVNKAFANVGDTLDYTIVLNYTGNSTANNVLLIDTIPNGTSFSPNSLRLNNVTQTGASPAPPTGFTITALTLPGVYTITYTVLVTTIPVPNPIPNQANISYTYASDTTVSRAINSNTVNTQINYVSLPSVKTVDKAYAKVGDTLLYTIVYRNQGTTTALNVVLRDTIPTDTSFVPNSVRLNDVQQTGGIVAPPTGFTIGTVPAGGTVTVTYQVLVNTIPTPNPIPNNASASYNYIVDPCLGTTKTDGSNTGTVSTRINTAVISQSKRVSQTNTIVGETVGYTIVLRNTGNTTANSVFFTDTIPNGTTFEPDTLTVNGSIQTGANPQTGITLGNIPVGGVVTVGFVVFVNTIPDPNPTPNTSVTNYNYLVDPSVGTNATGSTVSNTVGVYVNPDSNPLKVVSSTWATVGQTIAYTILWRNVLNQTQTNVTFVETIPNGTTFEPNSVVLNNVQQPGATVTLPGGINAGSVGVGGIATLTFQVRVNTIPTPNPIPNTADVTFTYITDPTLGTTATETETSNQVNTKVNFAEITRLNKSVSKSVATIDQSLTYTIVLYNNGNTTALNVLLLDTIPNGTSFMANTVRVNGIQQPGAVVAPPTGFTLSSLPAGGTVTISFDVLVNTIPTPNPTPNAANVGFSYVVNETTGTTNSGSGNTNIVSTTILSVTISNSKRVNKAFANVGDTLLYTIVLNYSGNTTAQGLTLIDTIPNGTTFVSNSVTLNSQQQSGVSPAPPSGYVIGSLTLPGTYTITYQVLVTTIPVPNPIPNQANIAYTYQADTTIPRSINSNTVNTQINYVSLPSVKTVDKAYAKIGDTLLYTLVYQNTGTTTATSVVVRDTIPNDTTFVTDSIFLNGTQQFGATIAPTAGFSIGTIPAGSVVTLTFIVKVNTIPNPNPIPNTASASYSYVVDPSVGTTKTDGSNTQTVTTRVNTAIINPTKTVTQSVGVIGETIAYTIVMKNTGNVTATQVVFKDTIPQGTVLLADSVRVNNVQQLGENPQNGINLSDIPVGGVTTILFVVTLTSVPIPNPTPNTGIVNFNYLLDPSVGTNQSVSNSTNTVATFINQATTPTKIVDKTNATVGDTLTYSIIWKNLMNQPQSNVTFTDTIPNNTTFQTGSITVNGVSVPTATLTPPNGFNIGTVPIGATITLTFIVKVDTIPNPNPIPNTATTKYTYVTDPTLNTTKTLSGVTNTVNTQINLAELSTAKKTVTKSVAAIGDTIGYSLTFYNNGNVTANNITLFDTIPNGTAFVADSIRVNDVIQTGATIAPPLGFTLGSLGAGQTVTVSFVVFVNSVPTPNPTPNSANATYDYIIGPETTATRNSSANTNIVSTTILDATIVSTKSVDKTNANLGDTLTYTIRMNFSGNTTANNVTLIDTIPNGTTFIPGTVTLNSVPQGTANPAPPSGYTIGSLTLPGIYVVTFQVKVTTIPNPNPIPNQGVVSYNYVTDRTINQTGVTNQVFTQMNYVTLPSVKTVDKAYAAIGDTLLYTVVYYNAGTTTALNVVMTDTIPTDTTFVADSVRINDQQKVGLNPAPPLGVTVGTIAAGERVTVTFQVKVVTIPNPNPIPNTATGTFSYVVDPVSGTTATGNTNTGTVTTRVNTAIINPTKSVTQTIGVIGDTVAYTIVLRNTGNTTATNITFRDTIPNGTVFMTDTLRVNDVVQTGNNPQAGINLSDIPVGGVTTITFVVTLTSIPSPNPTPNTGIIGYSYLVDPSTVKTNSAVNSTNTVSTYINPSTTPSKRVDKTNASVGDTLLYTLTWTNVLNVTQTSVTFSDTIPNNTTFQNNSITIGNVVQPGATITPPTGLNVGTVAPNQTVVVTFVVKVDTIPTPNPIPNTATLRYTFVTDPTLNTTKTLSGVTNTVNTQINLAELGTVKKSVDKTVAAIGDTVGYTIVLGNSGNITALDVKLFDTIPNGVAFVNDSIRINGGQQLGAVIAPPTGLTIGTIPAGQTVTVTFVVVVNSVPTPNPTPNSATTTYDYVVDPTTTTRSKASGNTNVVSTTIIDATIVSTKTVSSQFANLGDTLTYTIVLNYSGNTTANAVTLIDTIPDGTTFVADSLRFNNVKQIGVSPAPPAGYTIGSLTLPGIYTITFDVKVTTIPQTNPIPNQGVVSYNYTADRTISQTGVTNQVFTQMNYVTLPMTKQTNKTFAAVGETIEYTITYRNSGTTTAINVKLFDTIPNDTSFVINSVFKDNVRQTGAVVAPPTGFDVGTIPPGQTVTVNFQILVNTIPTPNPIPNDARSSFSYVVDPSVGTTATGTSQTNSVATQVNTAVISQAKTVNQTNAVVGDTLDYTILLRNTGNTTANNVFFTDTIPNGTTYITDTLRVNGNMQSGANPQAGITLGNLAVGAMVTVTFSVRITTIPTPNPTPNTGVAGYNYLVNPDTGTTRNANTASNTVATYVNPESNPLKIVDKSSATVGDTLTYTIVWRNVLNVPQTNVTLVDTIPNDTSFIPNSVKVDGIDSPGSTVTLPSGLNVGSVGAGRTVTITFSVKVDTIPIPNPIPNKAEVTYTYITDPTAGSTKTDTTPSNTVTTQVNLAEISTVRKSVDRGIAAIGDTFAYTIRLYNSGNVTATQVVVSDTTPNGTSFVVNSLSLNSVNQPGATIAPPSGFVVGDIGAGQGVTLTFVVKADTLPTPNPIPNAATVGYNYTVDQATGSQKAVNGNTNIVYTTILDATITNTKSVNKAYANVGDTLLYTVVLRYSGNTAANNVTLIDTIPNGTSFVVDSLTRNDQVQLGANPAPPNGYVVGTLTVPGTYTITYQVLVNTIPVPNPIPNQETISYNYVTDRTEQVSEASNTVTTLINYVTLPSTKTVDKAFAKVGDTLLYTVVYRNLGTTAATNVVLIDTIPNDTTFVPNSVTLGGNNQPGSVVAPPTGFTIGTIPAGQTVTVTYQVQVNTIPNPNPIPNTASASYNYVVDPSLGTIKNDGSHTNQVTTQINTAVMSQAKTVTASNAVVGDTLGYTIVLRNTGNTTATNVVFRDTIPNGTTFDPGTVFINNVQQPSANPQNGLTLGDIPVGGAVTIRFSVTINTIPTPNPTPNTGVANYNYLVDPSVGTTTTGNTVSNTVATYINPTANPLKIVDLTSATVGNTLTYTIVWRNVLNQTQTNVRLVDTIPNGTTFVPNSVTLNNVKQPGATVTLPGGFNIGSVASGSTVTITFEVSVNTVPNPNPIPNIGEITYTYITDPTTGATKTDTTPSNQVNTKVNLAELSTTKKAVDKAATTIGETLLYTVTLFNSGNTTAQNVLLIDTIPNGTSFVTNSVSINDVLSPGSVVSPPTGLTITSIPAGQGVTINFVVKVQSIPTPNPTPNSANVTYNYVVDEITGKTNNSSGNTNIVTTTILDATLTNSKRVNKAFANVGETLLYTVVINYSGNTPARNVVLRDTIPNGTTFVPDSLTFNNVPKAGESPAPPGGFVLGTLSTPGVYTVTYQVLVQTIPVPNPIPNEENISYDYQADVSIARGINSNVVTTQVNYVSLPSTKQVDQNYGKVGDTLTYTIVYRNEGTTTALGVVVKDTIPQDTAFVPDSLTLDNVPQFGATIAPPNGFLIGTIPAGSAVTLRFQVKVLTIPNPNPIPNAATASYTYVVDPSVGRNQSDRSQTNTVTTQINTAIITSTKAATQSVGVIGDTVGYTIVLRNTGNTTAQNVIFSDVTPPGTVFVADSMYVNNVNQPGQNPNNGVQISPIPVNGITTITFVVTLTTVPIPNPTPNTGITDFDYVVNPILGTTEPVRNLTNTVATFINQATLPSKLVDKANASVGDTLLYTVVWQNLMNQAQSNVTLTDTIPNNTTFQTGSVRINGVPNTLATITPPNGLNVGTVPAKETVTVTFVVKVDTIPVPNPIPNTATAKFTYVTDPTLNTTKTLSGVTNTVNTLISLAELGKVNKSVDKTTVIIDETLTYTLTVFNNGNVTAQNVTFIDTIPRGTVFVADSIRINNVDQPGAVIAPPAGLNVGNIAPGQGATITFTVRAVSIPVPNPTPNSASVNYSYNVGTSTITARTQTNIVSTTIIDATIVATKSVDRAFADLGDTLVYTITLNYTGNVPARNVTLIDTIPNGTSFVPDSVRLNDVPQPAASPAPPTGYLVGTLTQTGIYTISYRVVVVTNPVPNPIPNQASVSYYYVAVNSVVRSTATNTVTTQVNAVTLPLTKTVSKAYAAVGDTLTYTLRIQNTGTTTANNVVISDTIPSGTLFVPNSITINSATQLGATIDPPSGLSLGDLAAGATVVITFDVTVTTIPTPNPIPNTATLRASYIIDPSLGTSKSIGNNSNQVTTRINTAIVSQTKSVTQSNAKVGDQIGYRIVLRNTGNTTATNVLFSDTIPNGTSFVTDTLRINNVLQPGINPQNGVTIGDLAVGSVVTVDFTVLINTIPNPNPTPNTGIARYSYLVDPSTGLTYNGQTASNTVATYVNPDSNPLKIVDERSGTVGDQLTYTIIWQNKLNVSQTNVILIDTVPNDTSFVQNSVTINNVPSPGTTVELPSGLGIGTLAPGATVEVRFRVRVNTVPNPNPIPNKADVTFTYITDPTFGTSKTETNASNTVSTFIGLAELSVATKRVDKAFATIGDTIGYTIFMRNTGNVTALQATLYDTIPNYTQFVINSVSVNDVNQPGAVVAPPIGVNVGDLAPGQGATVTFVVMAVSVPTPNPVTNRAQVGYKYVIDQTTGATKNASAITNSVVTTVLNATLTNTKRANKAYATVGDTIEYTVSFNYTGNTTAQQVTLIDTIPNGTIFVPNSLTFNGTPKPGASPAPPTGYLIGDLVIPGVYTVVYQVLVQSAPVPNPIPNQETISYNFFAGRTINNSINSNTVLTQVNQANLTSRKLVDQTVAKIGDTLQYTLVYQNTGISDATQVLVIDTIPTGTTFVANSVRINGVTQPGAVVAPSAGLLLGTIAAGETITVTFDVVVQTLPTPNPIPNTASASYSYVVDPSMGPVVTKGTQTNQVTTQINTARMSLVKTTSQTNAFVGDILTYTIQLRNTGNVTATNTFFQDTIPPGTSFVADSFKVNNVTQFGVNPQLGYAVGPLAAGDSRLISFNVVVNTVPTPNPTPNTALTSYEYIMDPSTGNVTRVQDKSNTVATYINPTSNPLKIVDLVSATVGDTLVYTLAWKNILTVTQTNVIFVETIPNGTTFVANSITVNNVPRFGSMITLPGGLNVGSLGPNQTVTVTFRVRVNTVPNPNPVPNKANVTYTFITDPTTGATNTKTGETNQVQTQINLAEFSRAQKSVDKVYTAIGDTITYTIRLFNDGNVDAINVILRDTIPNGTTFVANSVFVNAVNYPGWVVAPPTGLDLGTIAAGTGVTVNFSVKVVSVPNPNPIPNHAAIDFDFVYDQNTNTLKHQQVLTNTVTTEVKDVTLQVKKTVSAGFGKIGDTLTYSVVMNLTGNTQANNVVLTDTLPSTVSFVPNSVRLNNVPVAGADVTPPNGYTLGSLAVPGVYTVTFDAVIRQLPNPNPITNYAVTRLTFTKDPTVPNTETRSAQSNAAVTTVNMAILNQITKSVDKAYALCGDTLTYTITIPNTGNAAALNVVFRDTVPVGTEFINGSVLVNTMPQLGANPIMGFSLGNIAPGQLVTVNFQVRITC